MQLQKEVKSNPKQPSCKKRVQPQKDHCEKRCEIQGSGCGEGNTNSPELSLLKFAISLPSQPFFHNGLFGAAPYFYSWAVLD